MTCDPSRGSPIGGSAADPTKGAKPPFETPLSRLPRTIRLDPSDAVVFDRAAEPGEWAVPGGFDFWDEDPAALAGKRRQEFRAGFLGLASFGFSTLVEVAEATPEQREAATAALAVHILAAYGAPDAAAARAAAAEEIAFAASLCDHPPGTVLALSRTVEAGPGGQEVRERFRTLHRREAPHRDFGALPVFAVVETEGEAPDRPDLTRLHDE
jgi:ADP-ribose pyrophosphatase YjhB (NUDIX family)